MLYWFLLYDQVDQPYVYLKYQVDQPYVYLYPLLDFPSSAPRPCLRCT